jgi:hypothetical protein
MLFDPHAPSNHSVSLFNGGGDLDFFSSPGAKTYFLPQEVLHTAILSPKDFKFGENNESVLSTGFRHSCFGLF